MNDESAIVFETRASFAFVRLNRPTRHNALTRLMLEELEGVFERIERERERLRAVVLTGTGERAFCAGTDIKELSALEAKLFSRLFATENMREGTRAFLEKRALVFEGK